MVNRRLTIRAVLWSALVDIERELRLLEEAIRDLLPDALSGESRAAFAVLDLVDEVSILLGLAPAYEATPHI
jgi:hypothetical protein